MKKAITAIVAAFITLAACAQPTGLMEQDKAPDFTAKDQTGATITLKNQLKKGPVVLIFYRGQWCPYCNKQLMKLEDSLAQITAKGATLIAVSPEKAENIAKTIRKTKASYPVVHDEGLKIMTDYKVAFQVDSTTVVKYKGYGIDFGEANGANGANLPVPAVYIIGKSGLVTWKYFDVNYSKRASVKEILEHL